MQKILNVLLHKVCVVLSFIFKVKTQQQSNPNNDSFEILIRMTEVSLKSESLVRRTGHIYEMALGCHFQRTKAAARCRF